MLSRLKHWREFVQPHDESRKRRLRMRALIATIAAMNDPDIVLRP